MSLLNKCGSRSANFHPLYVIDIYYGDTAMSDNIYRDKFNTNQDDFDFQTFLLEMREWMKNNPETISICNSTISMKSKFWTENDRKIAREEAITRNTKIVICNKCGVSGGETNMLRWHFDNCKTKLRHCQQCKKIISRQNVKDSRYKQKKFCNKKCYMNNKKGKIFIEMTNEIKNKLSISALKRSEELSKKIKLVKPWLKSKRWKK